MLRRSLVLLVLALSSGLLGCGGSSGSPVHPIKGTITVDGSPVEGIQVRFTSKEYLDEGIKDYINESYTDAQGNLQITTHKLGDGLRAGEYSLTFAYGTMNMLSRQYDGDKFKGKYADPAKSTIKLKVGPGEQNDFGTVNLTTK